MRVGPVHMMRAKRAAMKKERDFVRRFKLFRLGLSAGPSWNLSLEPYRHSAAIPLQISSNTVQ